MLKSITVQRAAVGNGILEPVQCSQNLQIAINNSDHITVLEPKLPLLHQAVSSVTANEQTQNFLDASALYDVRAIFHIETLEALGLQILSRVLLEDGESKFSFGRISEPMIVGHQWSPIEESTRDCYLGVLLNIGEVVVLKRSSLDASDYQVVFRSFTSLLDQLHIPQQRLTAEGDIILLNKQHLELKVTDFAFSKLPSGQLIISLAHDSGDITLHKLDFGLPLLERFETGGSVVKQSWSELRNCLYYALNDNSVHVGHLDNNGRLRSPPSTIKGPSRFLIYQLKASNSGNTVVAVDATSIYLLGENGATLRHKLPFRTVVSSVAIIETLHKSDILISYESGQMCLAQLKDKEIAIKEAPGAWQTFVNKVLYKYQLVATSEKNKAASEVFTNFLTDNVEANLINYGTQLIESNGTLVSVYSLSPKNTIHHEIKSRMEFTVNFLPVREIEPEFSARTFPGSTSLSALNSFFIRSIDDIPVVSGAITEGKVDEVKAFLDSCDKWKKGLNSDDPNDTLDVKRFSTLQEGLASNFRKSASVAKLQARFLLNVSILRTLHALNSLGKVGEQLNHALLQTAEENDLIALKIRQLLAKIVIQHSRDLVDKGDIDNFMLLNYQVIAGSSKENGTANNFGKEKITISTDICTESFEVQSGDVIQDDFLKYLSSTSGHFWPRCDLTLLPILDLTCRSDELELHNYSCYSDLGSKLYTDALEALNYCVFSGNRIFNAKVGV